MSQTADVIIIGGGMHGASLAFHLVQRKVSVILLEKSFIASGATGRSSGLVRMHYDTEVSARLAWASFQYFINWKEMVGGDCGFTRTGFLQFVNTKHIEALKSNVKMLQAIGIPTLLVDAGDVRRLAPCMDTTGVELAAYEPESGYAMPGDTATAFVNAARAMGCQLIQNCEVTGNSVNAGKVSGVETTRGDYYAPVVVNAAGAWANRLFKSVEVDLPYDTWQHDVMFVQRPREIGPSHPVVIDFVNEMYFRPEGKLTLVGLEDANPIGESPDSDTDHAKNGFVERAIDRICARIPVMEKGALHSAHGGYDGITPDQHAILGQIGPEGFFVDCGHSGTGFKTAPATGLCMAELILDGHSKSVDISTLAPTRFAQGQLIKGNYDNIWR